MNVQYAVVVDWIGGQQAEVMSLHDDPQAAKDKIAPMADDPTINAAVIPVTLDEADNEGIIPAALRKFANDDREDRE